MQGSLCLIEQACRGIRPPRTPVFDLLANDAVIEHFAGSPLNGMDNDRVVRKAASAALDGTRGITVQNRHSKTWIDPAGNVRTTDRWTSWLHKPAYGDVSGWAGWMRKYIEQGDEAANGDSMIELDLTENIYRPEKATDLLQSQLRHNEALGETVNIYCTPSTSINAIIYYIGLEMFSYLWMDFRDICRRWMEVYRHRTLNYIRLHGHHATSPLAMIYCDIAYKNGSMFSQTMFREMHFGKELEVIVHACHKAGLYVIFHSDGNVMEIMDDLTAAGIDGLNPIEKAAGMDIYEIRRRYPELILVGGMDATNLLRTGVRDEIRSETRRMIEEIGGEGRFLIGSSTEIGGDIPLDNYLTFYQEATRE
jgi:hypothetical protein